MNIQPTLSQLHDLFVVLCEMDFVERKVSFNEILATTPTLTSSWLVKNAFLSSWKLALFSTWFFLNRGNFPVAKALSRNILIILHAHHHNLCIAMCISIWLSFVILRSFRHYTINYIPHSLWAVFFFISWVLNIFIMLLVYGICLIMNHCSINMR